MGVANTDAKHMREEQKVALSASFSLLAFQYPHGIEKSTKGMPRRQDGWRHTSLSVSSTER